MKFFLVFLGGGIGSLLRYIFSLLLARINDNPLKISTLGVNIIGSLLIGIAWAYFEKFQLLQNYRLFIMIGILGGFTTFSSFALENLNLFKDGYWKLAIFYIFASNIGAILSAFVGYFGLKSII